MPRVDPRGLVSTYGEGRAARRCWTAPTGWSRPPRLIYPSRRAPLRTERIDPNEHATFAEIDTQVRALGGLAVNVEAIALTAPGRMHPVQAED
jgi:hypothetical protein